MASDDFISVTNSETGETIEVPRATYAQATGGQDDFLGDASSPFDDQPDFLGGNDDLTIEAPEPSFMGGVQKFWGNVPSALGYLGGKAMEVNQTPSALSFNPAGKSLDFLTSIAGDMGPEGIARAGAEGGIGAATSAIPFVGPALAPGAMAATSLGIDAYMKGSLPSMGEAEERLGEYYAAPIAAPLARAGLGKVGKLGAGFVDDYKAKKIQAENRFAELGEADALALRVDRSATPAQTVIAKEVTEAAPAVGETGIWDGGDTFNLKTKKFERSPDSTTPSDMSQIEKNLNGDKATGKPGALKQIAEERNSVIKTLDEASMPTGGEVRLGLTKPSELPVKEFSEISNRLKKSVFTREEAGYFDEIAKETVSDFNKLEGRSFLRGVYAEDMPFSEQMANNKGLSIGSLHDYLQNVYATQRALKRYDVSRSAAGDANPSVLARAGAEIKALDVLAGRLRSLLSQKSQEIIGRRGLDIDPNHLNELNDVYSNLKTISDYGVKPFIQQTRKSLDTITKELPPDASMMYAIKKGKDKLMEKVYPPSMKFKATGDDAIKALQKATQLRQSPLTASAPKGPVAKLPRDVATLARLAVVEGGTALPPELTQSKGWANLVQGLKSTAENKMQALSDFISAEPELAEQFLSDSPYQGYNAVQGEDGAYYLHDDNQKTAFAQKIIKEEKDTIVQARKLKALNESGQILEIEKTTGKSSEPSMSTTNTINGKRQEPDF